ncbi:MAG: hypothetical protein Q4A67_06590 [Aerococcus sp.]|nr:hypothetical protein [Aerococcus sp.]
MNDALQWQKDLLEQAKAEVMDYETCAFMEACEEAVVELAKRQKQAQGQLDGMMWDHEEW